jgi:hypothetical protein
MLEQLEAYTPFISELTTEAIKFFEQLFGYKLAF